MADKMICFRGITSGYHPCCVRWFELRWRLLEQEIGGNKIWYYRNVINNKIVGIKKLQPLVKRYMAWRYPESPRTQHIQCPYHKLTDRHPKYMTCETCGWHQLERWKGLCLRCEAILDLDAVKVINDYHVVMQQEKDRYNSEEEDIDLPCVIFSIRLADKGLGSDQAANALEVRHQIEADMIDSEMLVDGGGMGEDSMEIFVYSSEPEEDAKKGQQIIKKYGMQSEFQIVYPGEDEEDKDAD